MVTRPYLILFHLVVLVTLGIAGYFNGFATIAMGIYVLLLVGHAIATFRYRIERRARRAELLAEHEDDEWVHHELWRRRNGHHHNCEEDEE